MTKQSIAQAVLSERKRATLRAFALSLGMLSATCLLSSCSSAQHIVGADPFAEPPVQMAQNSVVAEGRGYPYCFASPEEVAAERARLLALGIPIDRGNSSGIEQASFEVTADEEPTGIVRVAAQVEAKPAPADKVQDAIKFTPAEPRVAVAQNADNLPCLDVHGQMIPACVMDYPDEYLFDGGDRATPVAFDKFGLGGLETEDTVAEYSDEAGKIHHTPSNCVAVYSPRFAALRTITSPQADFSVDGLAAADNAMRSAGMIKEVPPLDHVKNDSPGGMQVRSRASGLDADVAHVGVEQTTMLAENVDLTVPLQDLQFVATGRYEHTESARLSAAIQAAAMWTKDENPVIVATDVGPQELFAVFEAHEMVGVEEDGKPGRLRIVKLADKEVAAIGEIVTFTIRYDNMGDREVRNVRILDNLTPRLEYVENSATSDRAGKLNIQDNEFGSIVLEYQLEESLPGHAGGVVTFQARVR